MGKILKIGVPFESKLIGVRNIEERNKVFKSLSDEEKRKEIAYDALYLAVTRQLTASEHGMSQYWSLRLNDKATHLKSAEELQTLLVKKIPKSCEVCQRGLMMVSQIRLGNTVKPNDRTMSYGDEKNLKGFSVLSFKMMESLYEGWSINRNLYPYEARTQEMLANICCNVIQNGDFVIKDTTNYLKLWGIKITEKPVKTSIKKILKRRNKNEKV